MAERRAAELRSGKTVGVSVEQALVKARRRLGRVRPILHEAADEVLQSAIEFYRPNRSPRVSALGGVAIQQDCFVATLLAMTVERANESPKRKRPGMFASLGIL